MKDYLIVMEEALNFEDEILLRMVDCNIPNLINRGILINKVFLELKLEINWFISENQINLVRPNQLHNNSIKT
jgi:hypothetical protein